MLEGNTMEKYNQIKELFEENKNNEQAELKNEKLRLIGNF